MKTNRKWFVEGRCHDCEIKWSNDPKWSVSLMALWPSCRSLLWDIEDTDWRHTAPPPLTVTQCCIFYQYWMCHLSKSNKLWHNSSLGHWQYTYHEWSLSDDRFVTCMCSPYRQMFVELVSRYSLISLYWPQPCLMFIGLLLSCLCCEFSWVLLLLNVHKAQTIGLWH